MYLLAFLGIGNFFDVHCCSIVVVANFALASVESGCRQSRWLKSLLGYPV